MLSTMQDAPLLVSGILRHGQNVYGDSRVLTITAPDASATDVSFSEVAARSEQLAKALARIGVGDSDRVGTFLWNNQTHLEAYLAIPAMGAVLHTLNLRLFPEQLAYVINHGEDQVIIVDDTLVPLLARVRDQLTTVKHIVVAGSGDGSVLGDTLSYEEMIQAEEPGYAGPPSTNVRRRPCATHRAPPGTPRGWCTATGRPPSTRWPSPRDPPSASTSSTGSCPSSPCSTPTPGERRTAAFMTGADMIMPQQFLQAEPLAAIMARHRPTVSAGVPTIWNDLLRFAQTHSVDMSSIRIITAGGAAVPRQLIEHYQETFGVELIQGWGMTETSPLCALAIPPRGTPPEEEIEWRAKTGRVVPGVEIRVVGEDGSVLPSDGESLGEFEARGPWITGSYYRDPSPERFHDGWLRTGDIGTLDRRGFMQISDRTKDVIKSGGEWISSVELENEVMAHPAVVEAAVIAVPDERWSERPLAAVVLDEGAEVTPDELVEFLSGRVSRWWLPERWVFVDEIPKTSVGKFDKKVLRSRHAEGALDVIEVDVPRPA